MKLTCSSYIFIIICLVFACTYYMLHHKEPSIFYEGLQNMDASYLYYADNGENISFANKLTDPIDVDLSNILLDDYYNASLFGTYDTSGINLDIKYFNNISHVLMNYKLRNVLS